MSARYRQLAAHVRRLPNDDLNDLLVELPTDRFMALVDTALAQPVVPAGLRVRLVSAAPAEGWTVLAGDPFRLIGSVARGWPDGGSGRLGWRARTRQGEPVAIGGLTWWRRRADAVGALAWVTPASGAPLCGAGRMCPRPGGPGAQRPAGRAARGPVRRPAGCRLPDRGGGGMSRPKAKRCPRCGQVKPASQFYRRRHGQRLSPYCQPCQRAAAHLARQRCRQDPAAVDRLRAVERGRQRRHRALGDQGSTGGDAA